MAKHSARLMAETLNRKIIKYLSVKRVMVGVGGGERAPQSLAGREIGLVADAGAATPAPLITSDGQAVTRRRFPQILAKMKSSDPRRMAAEAYADAVERVGSMGGANLEGSGGGGGASDGAATTRVQYATTIRKAEEALVKLGVALAPKARGGKGSAVQDGQVAARQPIAALDLMRAICVDAHTPRAILIAAHWSGQARDVARLNRAVEICLELMARALGVVPHAAHVGTLAPLPDPAT